MAVLEPPSLSTGPPHFTLRPGAKWYPKHRNQRIPAWWLWLFCCSQSSASVGSSLSPLYLLLLPSIPTTSFLPRKKIFPNSGSSYCCSVYFPSLTPLPTGFSHFAHLSTNDDALETPSLVIPPEGMVSPPYSIPITVLISPHVSTLNYFSDLFTCWISVSPLRIWLLGSNRMCPHSYLYHQCLNDVGVMVWSLINNVWIKI